MAAAATAATTNHHITFRVALCAAMISPAAAEAIYAGAGLWAWAGLMLWALTWRRSRWAGTAVGWR